MSDTRRRILVVDDEPVIAELIADLLVRYDYEVEVRASVAEARESLAESRFDLCVTDYLLPDGTGLDLAESAITAHPGLHFLLITAYLEPDLEARVEATPSILAKLRKPMDIFELKRCVDDALAASAGSGPTGSEAAPTDGEPEPDRDRSPDSDEESDSRAAASGNGS